MMTPPTIVPYKTGWIEVICGSMFSGKTEELIRRLRRAQIAKQQVEILKPLIDNRYSEDYVVSHNSQRIASHSLETAAEVLDWAKEAQVIGIDEAQFFDDEIIQVVQQLANEGKRVIVAGLDTDYRALPFGPMPQLLSVAEYITKTLAICMQCGNPASFTQRLTDAKEQVVVGASDVYEARCRRCYEPPTDGS